MRRKVTMRIAKMAEEIKQYIKFYVEFNYNVYASTRSLLSKIRQ